MKAVMYGAGSIGRGFIAQLFYESGYDTVFIDIDRELIGRINARGEYPLRFVDSSSSHEITVGRMSGICGQDEEAVAEAIAEADLAATSVGKNVLPLIAGNIAKGIRRRKEINPDGFLNIIVCENMLKANVWLKELISGHLTEEETDWMNGHIGMVETCIGRNVPVMTPDLYGDDPLRVLVEDYTELPVDAKTIRGTLNLKHVEPEEEFGFYIRQKLFMYNMAHAVIGYTSAMRGMKRLCDAVRIPEIKYLALQALTEISMAMADEYGRDLRKLLLYCSGLLYRFGNRQLGIAVPRLCQEPLRKVSKEDRMTGAACLCAAHGIFPAHICVGIAAGYAYDDPEDAESRELQAYIAENGIEKAVEIFSELEPGSGLHEKVCSCWRALESKTPLDKVIEEIEEYAYYRGRKTAGM